MRTRHLFFIVMGALLMPLCDGSGSSWSQTAAEPSGDSTQQSVPSSENTPNTQGPGKTADVCLTEPIEVAVSEAGAGEKAKSAGKGILGSILSSASGGAVGSGGKKGPRLARRPRYPKSKLGKTDSSLHLEFQGAKDEGAVRVAVRVNKDPDKGSPHLIVLQDINCRILLPAKVEVFEFWGKAKLQVGWSSSTYQNGRLAETSSGGWNTDWTGFKERYPNRSDIPGIWQSYGEPPFNAIRGVIAEFQLPPTEPFNPEDWYLVTHITRRGPSEHAVTTEPIVTGLKLGKGDTYVFGQAQNVGWRAPAAQASVMAVNGLLASDRNQGLICEKDCKKILDEINGLECVKEDCSARKAAAAALQAHADALQARQDAQNGVDQARADIGNAQRALDQVRAEQSQADRKLAIEAEKQQRLQDSLRRGGLGLGAGQTRHAMDYSRGVVSGLEQNAADAQAAVEDAQTGLNAANSALATANAALDAANADVDQTQQQLDAAKKALSDCMQREWERCRAVEDLWADYERCRHRCREQDKARSDIDNSGADLASGQQVVADAEEDYEAKAKERAELEAAAQELGGREPAKGVEAAQEAKKLRARAEQNEREAQQKLKQAESEFQQGDLEGAKQSAEEARNLEEQAEEAMEDAADEMRFARDEARREYEKELEKRFRQDQAKRAAAARAAALKSQVCLRYISEYYEGREGNASLLEELGGFVSGEAKEALDEAGGVAANPEQLQEFLAKLEEQRQNLERLLTFLNGIGDNASMEQRNEAFATALEISGEIAERIPGLGEFFNFYSSAYNAAVNALYALQEDMVNKYKPMADGFIRLSRPCCSYGYKELDARSLDEMVDESWGRFERSNRTALSRLSPDSLRKLEAYFKNRQTTRWITCCLEYTLNR